MQKHILTIDDEENIRFMLSEALISAGYRVTAVGTLAEAIHVVKTDPPNLVITDLQLVDSDGFAVIEQVKALDARVPILLLTGVLMNPSEIPEGVARQIAGYVPKTASLMEIEVEIRKWVG